MIKKLLAIITISILSANMVFAAASKAQNGQGALVALLPASDVVAVTDVKQLTATALPQLLSGNNVLLGHLNDVVEETKTNTGIDLRMFETLAVGATANRIAEKKYEFDAVFIARGKVNSKTVIDAAKKGLPGKFREETVGERSLVIFSAAELAMKHAQDPGKANAVEMVHNLWAGKSGEVAVTALDANTIVFGSLERVRTTVEGKSRVSSELQALLKRNTGSVAAFAAKVPYGLSEFLPLDNDELGRDIDSIRYVFGSMNVKGPTTSLQATAQTELSTQAASLKETFEGLQILGSGLLGGSKSPDKQVYARLVETAKFTSKGNEVTMDIAVSGSDMAFLVGLLKK